VTGIGRRNFIKGAGGLALAGGVLPSLARLVRELNISVT
jgi:hypothetical protein